MGSQVGTATSESQASDGSAGWGDPGLLGSTIYAADTGTNYATVTVADGQVSDTLTVVFTGFAIPAGSTILGVTFSFERFADSSDPAVSDHTVNFSVAGSPSSNLASGANWPAVTPGLASYGSTNSLNGASASAADINATGVSLSIQVQVANDIVASNTAHLNHATLTVYYSTIAPGPDNGGGRGGWHNGGGGPNVQLACQTAQVQLEARWRAVVGPRLLKYPITSPVGPAWPFKPVQPPRYRVPRDIPRARLITGLPPATVQTIAVPRIVAVRLPFQYWLPDW